MDNGRIQSLDGLRAFAILFVLISHSAWKLDSQITIKLGEADLQNLFYNGWFGVGLFFVLSGFLIASQLLKHPINKSQIKNFMCKRFFRIAPAYYIAVSATLVSLHIYPEVGKNSSPDLMDIWTVPLISHLLFVHDYIGRFPWIDGIFWSIPIEIKFYMVLPFFIYLLNNLRNNTNKITMIASFYGSYIIIRTYYIYTEYGTDDIPYLDYFFQIKTPFHMALDGLTIGVLCAFILKSDFANRIEANTQKLNIGFYGGLILFSILALPPHFTDNVSTLFERTIMASLFSISFGIILICLIKGCCATEFFSNKILKFIARISYSLYLTHTFALSLQERTIEQLQDYFSSPTTCWILSMPVFFVCSIITATILYVTVERPVIHWSRKRWSNKTDNNV